MLGTLTTDLIVLVNVWIIKISHYNVTGTVLFTFKEKVSFSLMSALGDLYTTATIVSPPSPAISQTIDDLNSTRSRLLRIVTDL